MDETPSSRVSNSSNIVVENITRIAPQFLSTKQHTVAVLIRHQNMQTNIAVEDVQNSSTTDAQVSTTQQ